MTFTMKPIFILIILSFSCNTGKLDVIAEIDNDIDEASALEILKGSKLLWTIEDAGNKNYLYGLNLKGHIKKKIKITNAKNNDWEDLTSDNYGNIYIGDFGNNNGDRTDLEIYRFEKSLVPSSGAANISPQSITFAFEDQVDFSSNSNTNFDCEAMVYFNDSLHLFTKNRGDFQVKHYVQLLCYCLL